MKIGKYKVSSIRILRYLSQILFFIFMPALFISTFAGIKQIYVGIINQSFDFSVLGFQLIEVFAIIPLTILLGRFFCGWMCSFGTLSDFIYLISPKIIKKKFTINEKWDNILKYSKYILLIFLIVAVWTLGIKTFATSNPWDAFGMLFVIGKEFNIMYVITNLLPSFILLIAILITSLFVERFFCRYLCPLGAVFSIISKIRIAYIRKDKTDCGKCTLCTKKCSMGIPLYKTEKVRTGECINCFDCIPDCPHINIKYSISKTDVNPFVAGTVAVAVMAEVYYAGTIISTSSNANVVFETPEKLPSPTTNLPIESPTVSPTKAPQSKYTDGTYEGTGRGYRNATTVSVKIKNDKIYDISIISTDDDGQFINRAYQAVAQSIISSQSSEVDAVSGATYSSVGIMSAVEDALQSALRK